MFLQDLGDAALTLNLLPEVLVAREVDAVECGKTQLKRQHGRDRGPRGGPPAQLVAELVHEGAADDVRPELERVDAPDEQVPHEPADDGEREAGECDCCFVVTFQDPSSVALETMLQHLTSER